jgi:hypothetical protein
VTHQVEQPRIAPEEVLTHVGAVLDGVLLVLPVHDLAEPLGEQAVGVPRLEVVPVAAPDHLDDVPPGPAEDGLELLDDLAVTPHGAIQALQVAVDHEDQVVELFARPERDRAERLGLVGLAVAQEGPHLLIGRALQAAVLEVAVEPGLVDRHDGPEPHRHGRELPELRHEPRVRVRGQAATLRELAPEVLELAPADAAFQERPRVNARRGMTLEVDDVALLRVGAALEEVVEAHLVERRRRRVRRDVAADPVTQLVRADHHGECVPADEALDAPLDTLVARERGLLADGDRVRVRRVRRERDARAGTPCVRVQLTEEVRRARRASRLQDVVERLEPLMPLDGLGGGILRQGCVSHEYAVPWEANRPF